MPGTSLVPCTSSIRFISFFVYGFQIGSPYSKCGLTILMNNSLKTSLSRLMKVLHSMPTRELALFTFACVARMSISRLTRLNDIPRTFSSGTVFNLLSSMLYTTFDFNFSDFEGISCTTTHLSGWNFNREYCVQS